MFTVRFDTLLGLLSASRSFMVPIKSSFSPKQLTGRPVSLLLEEFVLRVNGAYFPCLESYPARKPCNSERGPQKYHELRLCKKLSETKGGTNSSKRGIMVVFEKRYMLPAAGPCHGRPGPRLRGLRQEQGMSGSGCGAFAHACPQQKDPCEAP